MSVAPLSDAAQALLIDMLQGPVRLVTPWQTRGERKLLFRYQRDAKGAPLHAGEAVAELGRQLLVDIGFGDKFVLSETGKALAETMRPADAR